MTPERERLVQEIDTAADKRWADYNEAGAEVAWGRTTVRTLFWRFIWWRNTRPLKRAWNALAAYDAAHPEEAK